MPSSRRRILLVQLPIPPVGPGGVRGNVPLAAGYLKMVARRRGLEGAYQIDILPTPAANLLGDRALVAAILAREPWMVGFSCYLWNIDRTLWIAARLKEARPDLLVLLGGPEITPDNDWVLRHGAVDFAAIGEGEQTFCELLAALETADRPAAAIPGLYVPPRDGAKGDSPQFRSADCAKMGTVPEALVLPPPRKPLANLDEISSPYLEGILDAADEQMLLLETIRGCIFKCKFCFYPKSYDALYFLPEQKIVANLEHAARRGAREVVLLDPTLNQRRDFPAFLRLLALCNPQRQFTYFGELRAEGIDAEVARLLHEANFTEVEIGLQSIDPRAMELMDRKNNLRAFERGARAMLDLGIRVKVDLIIGLPGDTVESIRRGIEYVHSSGLYSDVQVFNLAVLPGTAFRQEAALHGLEYQDRPPYYVLRTPTLDMAQMAELMEEAQETFETEFDPLPEPVLGEGLGDGGWGLRDEEAGCIVDLDGPAEAIRLPAAAERAQAFTIWLRSGAFDRQRKRAAALIDELLADNPYTSLQIVLEPTGDPGALGPATFETLLQACLRNPTYLDRFYSVMPGRPRGAKRLIVLLRGEAGYAADTEWLEVVQGYADTLRPKAQPVGAPLPASASPMTSAASYPEP